VVLLHHHDAMLDNAVISIVTYKTNHNPSPTKPNHNPLPHSHPRMLAFYQMWHVITWMFIWLYFTKWCLTCLSYCW